MSSISGGQNPARNSFESLPTKLRSQWWWFDSANEPSTCDSAFKWEVLRRSGLYRRLWQDKPALARPSNSSELLVSLLKQTAIHAMCSPFHRLARFLEFDPGKTWPELSASQRSAREFDEILPRLNAMEKFGDMGIGVVEITTDAHGVRRVADVGMSGDALAIGGFTECEAFQHLADGKWTVILFEAHCSPEELKRQFEFHKKESPLWQTRAEYFKNKGFRAESVHMLPGRFASDTACLIPNTCDFVALEKSFLNAVRRDRRREWLPACEEHWRIQTEESGLMQRPKPQLMKSGLTKRRWIALAAHGVNPLRMNAIETRFLSRKLVARKYDSSKALKPGRPATASELRELIVQMALQNRWWGCAGIKAH